MKKVLIATAAASVFLLAGCTSNDVNQATTDKIDDLTNQVSKLTQDVQALQTNAQQNSETASEAEQSAKRANDRLDNIAQSYTK